MAASIDPTVPDPMMYPGLAGGRATPHLHGGFTEPDFDGHPHSWFSPDGTQALNNWSISEDGEWLAYAVSQSGSDWQTWHIRNVSSGADLPEALEWSKFSDAGWLHDASGFFDNRYPAPEVGEAYQQANYNQELYFHRLGTPQAQDRLVYRRPDQPQWGFGAQVSDDGAYLLLSAGKLGMIFLGVHGALTILL